MSLYEQFTKKINKNKLKKNYTCEIEFNLVNPVDYIHVRIFLLQFSFNVSLFSAYYNIKNTY